jgi:hypothetical protein
MPLVLLNSARPPKFFSRQSGSSSISNELSGKACGPVGPGGILKGRQEVRMGDEEAVDGAIKDDGLHLLMILDRRNDLVQL